MSKFKVGDRVKLVNPMELDGIFVEEQELLSTSKRAIRMTLTMRLSSTKNHLNSMIASVIA